MASLFFFSIDFVAKQKITLFPGNSTFSFILLKLFIQGVPNFIIHTRKLFQPLFIVLLFTNTHTHNEISTFVQSRFFFIFLVVTSRALFSNLSSVFILFLFVFFCHHQQLFYRNEQTLGICSPFLLLQRKISLYYYTLFELIHKYGVFLRMIKVMLSKQ